MSVLQGPEYGDFLERVKERVRTARVSAALAANRELMLLYWSLGRDILERQARLGWGAKVVARLSRDLRHEFPDMKGFSPRNLGYMRAVAEAWPDEGFVQQVVAQLPWGHVVRILDRAGEPAARQFYVEQALAHGWSRDVLLLHLDRRLHERQGQAVTNFQRTLHSPRSDLARQTLKDPYIFDFLGITEEAAEREIERAMIAQIRDTLVEMGAGFAFVGQQVRLEVAGDEFFLDLLFYQLRLHCYVVVELKAGDFKPEYAGKLNFYLSAVDDLMRDPKADNATIGLLLCRTKNRLLAEYALRDIHKPIGVADLNLTRLLPGELKSSLPTVEALEAELGDITTSGSTPPTPAETKHHDEDD